MKILVLGATGMLGSTMFNFFLEQQDVDVWGTVRSGTALKYFPQASHNNLIANIDVLEINTLIKVFDTVKPDLVINCIGIIKQLASAKDPLTVLPINSMLPHQLAQLCSLSNARLIHYSTDCVFSGEKGHYDEQDVSDSEDLYGKSKFIGEVSNLGNVLTIRTSIIGHELSTHFSLVDWFLNQEGKVKGYINAIFSGLPTIEHARIIKDYVINNKSLSGLYQVAANPINKYELLKLIAECYDKKIDIIPDDEVKIDRSLSFERFQKHTGYEPLSWPDLINNMYQAH